MKKKQNKKQKLSLLNAQEIFPIRLHFAAGFSLFTFIVYVLTLSPTVGGGGDSGELTVVAYTMGVAHPPGYPLFTLIGKLFTLIPFGTVGWRVNLLSAVMSSLACFFFCMGLQKLTKNVFAGFLGAGISFFSPIIWSNSVVAEVFSMNIFFICLLFFLSVRYWESKDQRFLYWAAFCFGLGLSNHHTLLLIGLPLGIWFILQDKDNLRLKQILKLTGLVLFGMLPYVYIPIAAARVPIMNWGDASSWNGFWAHFLRTEYGTFSLSNEQVSSPNIFINLWSYFKFIPSQTVYLAWIAGLAGIVHLIQKKRWKSLTGLWLSIAVFYLLVFCGLSNLTSDTAASLMIQSRFYQMPILILAILISYAFAVWGHYLKRAAIPLVAIFVLVQIIINYKTEDQSKNLVLFEYSKSILESMPRDSILLIHGDYNLGGFYYAQNCENIRNDVAVIPMAYISRTWGRHWVETNYKQVELPEYGSLSTTGYNLYDFFYLNHEKHDIFTTGGMPNWDISYQSKTVFWQWGLIMKFMLMGTELNFEEWMQVNEREFDKFAPITFQYFKSGTWERTIYELYLDSRFNFAASAINYGAVTRQIDPLKLYEASVRNLLSIEDDYGKSHPLFYKNLGLAYMRIADFDPSKKIQGVIYWQRYLDSNPPDDEEVRLIRSLISK